MDAQLLAAKYNDFLINPNHKTQRLAAEVVGDGIPEEYLAEQKRREMRRRGIFVLSEDRDLEPTYFEHIDAVVRPYICKCVER